MTAGSGLRFQPIDVDLGPGETDGPTWVGDGWLIARPDANEIVKVRPDAGDVVRFRHSTCGNRGLAIGPDGRVFGAQSASRRIVWYAPDGGTYLLNAMLGDRRHNDPQDLVIDTVGQIWFSDDWTDDSHGGPVGWPPLEHRSILRLRRVTTAGDGVGDWQLERMTTDTLAPRGIGLSPSEGVLYVTDLGDDRTAASLRAYPVSPGTGALGPGRILLAFEPGPSDPAGDRGAGSPDAVAETPGGLAVAPDGRIFMVVRGAGAGAVLELGPDGAIRARHPVPDAVPTNCGIGGQDGRTVLLTTAAGAILAATLPDPSGDA